MDSHRAVQTLLIYDGLCGFCNGTVQWLLKRDKFDRFRFAPQQSELARDVLLRHGIDQKAMYSDNSVYLVEGLNSRQERLFVRSDVTVHSLLPLGSVWKVVGRCVQIVPRFLRDACYRLVARNRLRLAGRYEVCPLPTAAQRAKFLGITDS
jgi:predicted DCC family thiol-disulfide oxidoreductase YuxK